MQIRTITGPTIASALAEARELLGDDVVMLQAQPPSAGKSARITVGASPKQAASPDYGLAEELLSSQARAHGAAERRGRGKLNLMVEDLIEGTTDPAEGRGTSHPVPGDLRRGSTGSGRLMESRDIRSASDLFPRVDRQGRVVSPPDPDSVERSPESLTGVESPSQDIAQAPPTPDPRFATLVGRGIRPTRARKLCRDLPEVTDSSALTQALANMLPPAVDGRPPAVVAFVGEAGSGKTSLVLRSALSRVRSGRRAPTVIVIAPDRLAYPAWTDPTSMFESFDLRVVRCSAEALESAVTGSGGDVIIDTPAGTRLPDGLRVHTRLVVDARCSGSATAREGGGADSVVLTHLDRTITWGYAAERIIAMQLPVAALVKSARPDVRMEAYSPAKFAGALCHA